MARSHPPDLTAAQLLQQHCRALEAAMAAMRVQPGPEPVHATRVAARRLRTLLSALAPVLPARPTARLKRDLKALGSELGAARDAQIRVALLAPRMDRAAGRANADRLRGMARQAQQQLRARLGTRAFRARQLQIRRGARALIGALPRDRAAADLVHKALRHHGLKLQRALDQEPRSTQALHALRIRVKKCRYLLDCCPQRAGPAQRWCKRLQDGLGQLHDLAQTRAWLSAGGVELPDAARQRRALRRQARALRSKLRRQLRPGTRKLRTVLAGGAA